MIDENMVERVAKAIESVPPKLYFCRRLIDKSGYEVIQDTDPDGAIGDDTFKRVHFSRDQEECSEVAERLVSLARARAAIEEMNMGTIPIADINDIDRAD